MKKMSLLSRWEEVYLLSIWELEDNAYGVTIKKKVSKKTRSYQATEGPKIVGKMAQVVENPVTRTIVSFFLGLSKIPIPIKMFQTVDEAIKWLKED